MSSHRAEAGTALRTVHTLFPEETFAVKKQSYTYVHVDERVQLFLQEITRDYQLRNDGTVAFIVFFRHGGEFDKSGFVRAAVSIRWRLPSHRSEVGNLNGNIIVKGRFGEGLIPAVLYFDQHYLNGLEKIFEKKLKSDVKEVIDKLQNQYETLIEWIFSGILILWQKSFCFYRYMKWQLPVFQPGRNTEPELADGDDTGRRAARFG
jgi:hypothetical protein